MRLVQDRAASFKPTLFGPFWASPKDRRDTITMKRVLKHDVRGIAEFENKMGIPGGWNDNFHPQKLTFFKRRCNFPKNDNFSRNINFARSLRNYKMFVMHVPRKKVIAKVKQHLTIKIKPPLFLRGRRDKTRVEVSDNTLGKLIGTSATWNFPLFTQKLNMKNAICQTKVNTSKNWKELTHSRKGSCNRHRKP